jgi:uncharacterized protein (DUF4415 family)
MNKPSKTDWKRLDNMTDEDINFDDMPELSDSFFKHAEVQVPPKQPVTMRLDADVLDWFKSQGKGYQTRINKLLRSYMDAQSHHHP